jgi:hypothetical protein
MASIVRSFASRLSRTSNFHIILQHSNKPAPCSHLNSPNLMNLLIQGSQGISRPLTSLNFSSSEFSSTVKIPKRRDWSYKTSVRSRSGERQPKTYGRFIRRTVVGGAIRLARIVSTTGTSRRHRSEDSRVAGSLNQ